MTTTHNAQQKVPCGKIRSIEDLGRVVRARRKEAGLTQVEAAGLLGVGARFLGELERGKPTLEVAKVLQALQRLGLEVEVSRRNAT